MKARTRSRKPASIGSNHSSRRPTAISASEPRTGNFVLLYYWSWRGLHRCATPGSFGFQLPETTPPSIPTTLRTAPQRSSTDLRFRPACTDLTLGRVCHAHGSLGRRSGYFRSRLRLRRTNAAGIRHANRISRPCWRITGHSGKPDRRCRTWVKFAPNSVLEGNGFEPSVPGTKEPVFVAEGELRLIAPEKPSQPPGRRGTPYNHTHQPDERLGEKRQALVHPVIDTAMVVRELLVAMRDAEFVQPPHEPAGTRRAD